jgi:hypothetical protein
MRKVCVIPIVANFGTFAISEKDDDDFDAFEGTIIAYILCPSLVSLDIVRWHADIISEGAQPITATFIISSSGYLVA